MGIERYNLTNALAIQALLATKRGNSTEDLKKTENRPAAEETETNNTQTTRQIPQQQAPPTVTATIIKALERTTDAGSKAGSIFTEELFAQGQEAAEKEEANLTPNQRQLVNLATSATTQAVRQGISIATATAVAKIIVDEYKNNKNFDGDAVEVAALIVQDFMGGMQT